ncbi:MAG: YybH family protein [Longimicrobiales bacterium]
MRSRTYFVIPLLYVLGCGVGEVDTSEASTAADEAALRELTTSFDAAVNAQDIEAMMARYADDAVRMNPNLPTAVGTDAIRTLFLEEWSANESVVANAVTDVRVAGDLGATRGTWRATVTPRDGAAPIEDHGKWAATLERQPDGSWKSLWEIWSSDLPPRQE